LFRYSKANAALFSGLGIEKGIAAFQLSLSDLQVAPLHRARPSLSIVKGPHERLGMTGL
jgi:hypothetical protein